MHDSRSVSAVESDPHHHTAKIATMLDAVMKHVRRDISKVTDERARTLFVTTADVLDGLLRAYDEFDARDIAPRREVSDPESR